jgi:hypothetical protein
MRAIAAASLGRARRIVAAATAVLTAARTGELDRARPLRRMLD